MDFIYLIIITLISLSLISLYLSFNHSDRNPNKSKSKFSGFKTYPIVASLPEFLKNRDRLLEWFAETLIQSPTNTEIFQRSIGHRAIETANPENVEYILRSNFGNYEKGDRFASLLADFLGRGIFNSDGDAWRAQRKTASHEFSTKTLRGFVVENVAVEIETRLVPLLRRASLSEEVVDFQGLMERLAFDSVCQLAFGYDPNCLGGDGTDGAEFMKAFEDAAMLCSGRFWYALRSLWKVKRFFAVGSERRLREAINTVDQLAYKIIQSRMEAELLDEKPKQDLLSRFIRSGENYSPEFLRDIVISFILAGRDTSSSALTWFFWNISSRPDIQRKILTELEEIRTRNKKKPEDSYSFEDIREMNYLHAAISESMRLYPPVPANERQCQNDDVLPDGTLVKKNWYVTYHPYAMGRMESIWGKDCVEFSPERWIDEDGLFRQESPFRYPVFHGGARMCLGRDMAYIQMKAIAACVMERFEFEVMRDGNERPDYLLSMTLRMKGGLPIKVKEKILE